VDVHVEQAHLLAGHGKGQGNIRRQRALAYAALAGEHHDLVLDAAQGLGDLRQRACRRSLAEEEQPPEVAEQPLQDLP
jgi:hypothetical protein